MPDRALLLAWFKALRPLTLTAAIIPVLLGHTLAGNYAEVSLALTLTALLSAVCIQIGTNLYNDVIDFRTGADSEQRVGPKRLLQNGLASARQVANAAHAAFLLAFLLGIPLVLRGGWTIVLIGLLSLVLGYGYSAAPLKLAYRGWSELFVIFFFGILAVGGVSYVQLLHWEREALLVGLIVGLLSTNLLIVNNLRDIESDRRVNKLTLPARFGQQFGFFEFLICAGTAFALAAYWAATYRGGLRLVLLAFLPLLAVAFMLRKDPQHKSTLPLCALAHVLFGLFALATLLRR